MWFPQSADELLTALSDAAETTYIDYKRELPARKDNDEIAVDVAAMAVEGGVLIYGVAEDKALTTFTPYPIPLVGQAERIDNVVRAHTEGLVFSVRTYLDPDRAGEGLGYVVVVVPPSPLAPHNVEGRGMYGRGPTGNRLLTQGEIDRLYERRREFSVTAMQRIDQARAFSDVKVTEGDPLGVLRVVAAPLTTDQTARRSGGIGDDGNDLIRLGMCVRESVKFRWPDHYSIECLSRATTQTLGRGIRLTTASETPAEQIEVDALDDGTLVMAFGGILHPLANGGRAVFDAALAQMTAHILAMAGAIYEAAGYYGSVDLAVAVDNGDGAVSNAWFTAGVSRPAGRLHGVLRGVVVIEGKRTAADQLVGKRAVDTTHVLVAPILRAVRPPGWPDPLTLA